MKICYNLLIKMYILEISLLIIFKNIDNQRQRYNSEHIYTAQQKKGATEIQETP